MSWLGISVLGEYTLKQKEALIALGFTNIQFDGTNSTMRYPFTDGMTDDAPQQWADDVSNLSDIEAHVAYSDTANFKTWSENHGAFGTFQLYIQNQQVLGNYVIETNTYVGCIGTPGEDVWHRQTVTVAYPTGGTFDIRKWFTDKYPGIVLTYLFNELDEITL